MKFRSILALTFCALSLPSALSADAEPDPQITVLWDARSAPDLSAWRINAFENREDLKNDSIEFTPRDTQDGGNSFRMQTRAAHGFNLISPDFDQAVGGHSDPSGLYIDYRTAPGSAPLRLIAATGAETTYGALLAPTAGEWRVRALGSQFRSRKESDPLDFSTLRHLYFSGKGDMDFEVRKIALFSGKPPLEIRRVERKTIDVPAQAAAVTLDGRLEEKAWSAASVISNLGETDGVADPGRYPAEVRLLRQGSRLYIGAALKGETAPPVTSSGDWQPVWKDSSFAVFLCPSRNGSPVYQFIVNSAGMRQSYNGASTRGPRNWEAAARLNDGEWSLEVAIDLAAIDPSWTQEAVWSANFARFVVIPGGGQKNGLALSAGWTHPGGGPATRMGLLAFSGGAKEKTGPGAFLRSVGERTSALEVFRLERGSKVRYRLFRDPGTAQLTLPLEQVKTAGMKPVGGDGPDFSIAFPTPRDGRYFLEVESGDDGTRRFDLFGFEISRPSERNWTDLVLWPEPQKIDLKEGYLDLGGRAALQVKGGGDSFPGEFLADSLRERYGTSLESEGAGKPVLRLLYDEAASRPEEGYELEITPTGASIRARSGRGMYYGVRAFLDVCAQSEGSFGKLRARCLKIEDWPQVQHRAVYHFLGARYQVPMSVEAYKKFIYNEVAGGRYNLLFLCLNEAYRFDCAPGLASPTAWSKEELREIIGYARRHYVEICPALESPGHARWLVEKNPKYRYKGDRQTLDTGNPEALKALMACYEELIELFAPRFFHTGGDEVRWPFTGDPGELRREREMLLAHWTNLRDFLAAKGIRMLIFDDMLSAAWNGGAPRHTASILPDLPRDIILTSWSDRGLDNPPQVYRDLGFEDHWRLLTSFDPDRADRAAGWWPDYDGIGIGLFTFWPWTTFSNHRQHAKYSVSAIHLNAMLNWKPSSLAPGAERIVRENGRCWSRLMALPEWGASGLAAEPLTGESLSEGRLSKPWDEALEQFGTGTIGEPPYRFQPLCPKGGWSASGQAQSPMMKIGRAVRGLSLLHTAWISKEAFKNAQARFSGANRNPYGLEIGRYEIAYEDGGTETVPIVLGYNIQAADCSLLERALEGSPAFWEAPGSPAEAEKRPRAWVVNWVNPRPDQPVASLRLVSAADDLPISLVGINLVVPSTGYFEIRTGG